MAMPHISGFTANVWSSLADATAVRSWLQSNSDDIDPNGYDRASGFGFPHL